MDSKSNDVICSKSFTDINIDLGSKRIRHCCKAEDEDYNKLNWYQINNTPGVVRRRNESIKGIKNPQCNYCWKSNNAYKNIHNKNIEIQQNWDSMVNFIEIKFDNVCDLSCLYCNENDSSTIAKEKNIENPVLKYNEQDVDLVSSYVLSIAKTRQITINMLGGEPTLSKGYHKFIQNLIENAPNNKNIFLVTTSNGNMNKPVLKKIDSYIEKTNWNWIWGFSGESIDEVFNNIRFGCKWSNWVENVKYFDNKQSLILSFNPTINLLSVKTLPDYIEFLSKIKTPYYLNGNYVTSPQALSIQKTPIAMKKYILEAKEKFKNNSNCVNKSEVEIWFDNLLKLVGTEAYSEKLVADYLKLLNIQKNNKLNVELLMEQVNVF